MFIYVVMILDEGFTAVDGEDGTAAVRDFVTVGLRAVVSRLAYPVPCFVPAAGACENMITLTFVV